MKIIHAVAVSLLLASCATPQAPPPPTPVVAGFPDDTQLVCHEGWWTIVSESLKQMGVFNSPCGVQI